jgi:hypothetical protein
MHSLTTIPALSFAIAAIFLSANRSEAQTNTTATWMTWNEPSSFPFSDNGLAYATQTTGVIPFADGTQISVNLQGTIYSPSTTSQPSETTFNNSPQGWWQGGPFIFSSPSATWTSATLSNLPSNSDRIELGNIGGVQTMTFSEPIERLVMNIVTLGTGVGGVSGTWVFDQTFTILSQDLGSAQPFIVNGNSLTGLESSGTLLFDGPVSTLSWNITQPEGSLYTIGTLMTTVPEPSTYALLAVGSAAAFWALNRKRRKS